MLAVVVSFLAAIVGLLIVRWVLGTIKGAVLLRSIPRAPGGWIPYIGHGLALAQGQPWDVFRRWASTLGGTCRFHVLGRHVVYTTEPKLIKRILQTNQRQYSKDLGLSYKEFMCLLGRGLVTSEGQAWVRGRLQMSHAFRVDILEDVPQIAKKAVDRLTEKLSATAGSPSAVVDIAEEFRCLTLQVIAEAVLSLSPEESDSVFPSLYLPIVTECNERVWAPWRALMFWSEGYQRRSRCLAQLDAYLERMVERRWSERSTPEGKRKSDIFSTCMDHLADATPSATPTTSPVTRSAPPSTLSRDQVLQFRDDLKTFLLAGHETSAAMLSWAVYELCCRHPEYLEEVRREHAEVFGTGESGPQPLPSVGRIQGMKWAPAILREALRLYSVVPLVVRRSDTTDVIEPAESGLLERFTMPKDTVVMVGIDGVHKRQDVWGADAEVFKPQRFFDMTKIDPFAFIPFIAGPRNCIGQHLALLESTIVLSHLVWRFDFVLKDGVALPLERHHRVVPLAPADGLPVKCVPTKWLRSK